MVFKIQSKLKFAKKTSKIMKLRIYLKQNQLFDSFSLLNFYTIITKICLQMINILKIFVSNIFKSYRKNYLYVVKIRAKKFKMETKKF